MIKNKDRSNKNYSSFHYKLDRILTENNDEVYRLRLIENVHTPETISSYASCDFRTDLPTALNMPVRQGNIGDCNFLQRVEFADTVDILDAIDNIATNVTETATNVTETATNVTETATNVTENTKKGE